MTWLEHHRESERLASDAEVAARGGRVESARDLYSRAAQAEVRAIEALDHSKSRTLGISAVSAAALCFKAAEYEQAESLAARWLAGPVPSFAKEQLRLLLESVWAEQVRQQTPADFAPGQVLVSVRGGEVVHGGAPLDLITSKMKAVESIYHRTAEFLTGVTHRRRGQPSRQIQESCRPWLFQAAPGSYQFAVAVQGKQPQMFDDPLSPDRIADCFLRILRAGIDDPDGRLHDVVPDPEYRSTFLKLTRNLAPRSDAAESIAFRVAESPGQVTLDSHAREDLTKTIRKLKADLSDQGNEETLNGTLRAVHLDKDWLEVSVGSNQMRVVGVGEQVDDVIGPMVNKPVAVRVVSRDGKHEFLDIEQRE